MTDTPNPIGRPSKYKPAYCNEVIDFMGQGYSIAAFAGYIGVARDTILEWMNVHPEFSLAIKVAKGKRTMKLEGDLMLAESGPLVTSRIFALKNAAPEEWREKREIDHTSSDGSMTPKGSGLSDFYRDVSAKP
jgi:hypothetical protein